MAGYLGLKYKFLPNLRQYEATTGRQISDRAMNSFLYAANQTEADRAERQQQLKIQQQAVDAQKQAYGDQARAATISGVTQLANLPLQGYLGYKVLQKSGLIGGGGSPAQQILNPAIGTSQSLTAGTGIPGSLPFGQVGPISAVNPALNAASTTGQGLLGTLSTAGGAALGAAGLFGLQQLSAPAVQNVANKVGLPNAGKGWQIAGLPGLATGGAIDIFKKIGDFVGGLF